MISIIKNCKIYSNLEVTEELILQALNNEMYLKIEKIEIIKRPKSKGFIWNLFNYLTLNKEEFVDNLYTIKITINES